ncbi:SRPBCC family protein [Nocardia sp. 2]|uniref:SRPBCC family protein n=1 Tax=Nocardia acididurans TaxID=2802282 RepID=A0ABS1M8G8_9NOCA|nr:SRPBCC family protein [Nocardia acididurans]MBL1076856.1 SRPBCC family protein [Nocardia acididurans]
MGTITVSKELPATPEALFRTIISPGTWDHWLALHRDFVGSPPDSLAEGAVFVSEVLLHGMAEEVAWRVETLAEPSRVVLRGTGQAGVRCTCAYTLEPSVAGTTVTVSLALAGPLMTRTVRKTLVEHGSRLLDQALGQLGELAYALRP